MTTPRPGSRAEQRRRTEARILDAATEVFFGDGYDRATIRAVASAAGVDAGLVMHYFGSKQELYRRVIDTAPVPEVSGTPAEAAEQILAGLASRLASEPVASLAMFRSMLTNPEAASAASAGIAATKRRSPRPSPATTQACGPRSSAPSPSASRSPGTSSSPTNSPPPTRRASSSCYGPACSRWPPAPTAAPRLNLRPAQAYPPASE